MRKQKRRGMSVEVEKRFRELLGKQYSTPQIYEALVAEFGVEDPGMVTDRTLRQYVKSHRPPDPSGPWSLADDSEEAAFLLAVLEAVVERTEGRRTQLTCKEAEWLERIKRAVPDMPPWAAFSFARAYVTCETEGHETAPFDMALALTLDCPAERELGKAHIARHIDLHLQHWPAQPLMAWARETWIADEYEEAAKRQPAAWIIRDFAEMRRDLGEVLVLRF